MMDWDDLRIVRAVAAGGSLASAARALRLNHSTVLRRVAAFEKRLGLRLFERLPTGYVATSGGEELLSAAERIGEIVAGLEVRLAGQDLRLTGSLRVTTTDTLMTTILPDLFAGFRDAYPGIVVEVAVSNQMFNITRRDADVAIRPANDPPETLIGRRVGPLPRAIYGSRRYAARKRLRLADLAGEPWLAPDESLAQSSIAQWMQATLPAAEIVFRADSLVALADAAQAGLGLVALPCYLGDSRPGLVRVHPPVEAMTTALWLLTHPDLRRTARIRAFLDFAAAWLKRQRGLFTGRRAARPAGSEWIPVLRTAIPRRRSKSS
jgi:DNA-binding transcriptional LysR family regulator